MFLITNFIGVRANYSRLILPFSDSLLTVRQLEVLGRWIGPSPTDLSIESLNAVPRRFPRLLFLLFPQVYHLFLLILSLLNDLTLSGTELATHPSSRRPPAPRRRRHRSRPWFPNRNQATPTPHHRLTLSPPSVNT